MNAISIESLIEQTVNKTLAKMVSVSDKEREKFLQTHKILKSYNDFLFLATKIGEHEYNEAVKIVQLLDACFEQLRQDPNFDIIELKYFENFTDEQIAEFKNCDKSTVWRQRNELIHKLSYMLFPNQLF